ncbi:DUF262 domain-containing protein [Chryseobacterium sp.]|uniref:DUF262 domain-containing protein n=1 Tax=Chryseobacterium sp. TaxID=1871047 RepID=UPI00333F3B77
MDIQNLFKKIKIEPKVMGIETMFSNQRRLEKTNYKPSYQRNYVWDNEKATYFIESIILGTEIPPLIFFKTQDYIEVIDGRQRYETIYNFVKVDSKQKLTQTGLYIFDDLKNKKFQDLAPEIRNTFWDTKLRLIEFSFIDESDSELQEVVKREIFKRYNTGITPLKSTEIDKAKFLENELNSYFKKNIESNRRLQDTIRDVFYYDNSSIEVILKEIRKLLVLSFIPINYYSNKKDKVLNKFYEFHYEENDVDSEGIFSDFTNKLNYLEQIKNLLKKNGVVSNRLIFECLYWAITISQREAPDVNYTKDLSKKENLDKLANFIRINIEDFKTERHSFASEIITRYNAIATFFTDLYGIDFTDYLKNNTKFKEENRNIDISRVKTNTNTLEKFESLRLNKPDATSITIEDVVQQMKGNRFLIRPPYQREEVINQAKSSAIIESILLGIKLPPIFIFKRNDGVSEVIDGQQRLLSILGFTGKKYTNEKGKLVESKKHSFALNLKNGILKEYDKKRFIDLPKHQQDKILDFDLWIIEIKQKDNKFFEPIDLFLRLNSKPFPIKENTFEMWNSYIDRRIIDKIKEVSHHNESWFYLRKNNKRMDNEGLIASFCYLNLKYEESKKTYKDISSFLEIFLSGDKIQARINPKSNITNLLEKHDSTEKLINQINLFENVFLETLKKILNVDKKELSDELDKLISSENIRTFNKFYFLWLLIVNCKNERLIANTSETKKDINKIINDVNNLSSLAAFEEKVKMFWDKYNTIVG